MRFVSHASFKLNVADDWSPFHHQIVTMCIELPSQNLYVKYAALPKRPKSLAHENVLNDFLSE